MVHLTLYLAQEIKHWNQEMKRKNNLGVHENLPTAQKNMQDLQRHTSLMRNEMFVEHVRRGRFSDGHSI